MPKDCISCRQHYWSRSAVANTIGVVLIHPLELELELELVENDNEKNGSTNRWTQHLHARYGQNVLVVLDWAV
jgi:hypothetical protein